MIVGIMVSKMYDKTKMRKLIVRIDSRVKFLKWAIIQGKQRNFNAKTACDELEDLAYELGSEVMKWIEAKERWGEKNGI